MVRRKLKRVQATERERAEKQDGLQEEFRLDGAAIRIQLLWQRRKLWQNLRSVIRFHKQLRAIVIQSWYRRHRAKCELHRRRVAKINRDDLERRASTQLQAWSRRLLAEAERERLAFDRDTSEKVRQIHKARALQDRYMEFHRLSNAVGIRVRWNMSKSRRSRHSACRSINPFQVSKENRAALRIQTLYRRFHIRARVMWVKQAKRQQEREERERRRLQSAQLIQRVYWGYVGRKKAWTLKFSINQVSLLGGAGARWATCTVTIPAHSPVFRSKLPRSCAGCWRRKLCSN